jgi:ABC-type transporter Mla subunit MlaD
VGEGYAALVGAADAMRSLDDTLRAAGPPAVDAITEARAAAVALRRLLEGPLGGELIAASASLRAALARLPATLATIEATARRLDAVGADANRDAGPLLRDLRATADNLRTITEQMRLYPSQFLFGQPPPRPEERR